MRINFNDIAGQTFGQWKVLRKAESRKERTYWLCRCSCGKEKEVNASSLKRGLSTSCGCANRLKLDGQKFNKLTALKYAYSDDKGLSYYLFKCDCGNETTARASQVKTGRVKSCGCMQDRTSHGMSHTHEMKCYASMKQRCTNPNAPDYHNYGGRGIKVCDRWLESFENFLEDVGEIADNLELDRIDTNGNYTKSNVQLSTRKEQTQNTRCSKRWYLYGKKYKSLRDAAIGENMSKSQTGRICNGYTHANGKYHPPKDGCYSELVYAGGV